MNPVTIQLKKARAFEVASKSGAPIQLHQRGAAWNNMIELRDDQGRILVIESLDSSVSEVLLDMLGKAQEYTVVRCSPSLMDELGLIAAAQTPVSIEDQSTRAAESEQPLTFQQFRLANRTRCLRWHPKGIESWSDSDWITAIVGELGELASLVKMRNRERDGLPGNKFSPSNQQMAAEAADVFTYLDLFCERNGIDLGLSAAVKFNEVSRRVGFPDRIDCDWSAHHG